MKHILSIAYSSDNLNFDQVIRFEGAEIRLTQFSTNFDYELTKKLINQFDEQCDVICISGYVPTLKFGSLEFIHPDSRKIRDLGRNTPMVDGQLLKEIYIPWAIRKLHKENPHLLSKKRIAFYTGVFHRPLLEVMEELDSDIIMADPYFFLHLPFNIKSIKQIESFLRFLAPVFKRMPVKKSLVTRFQEEDKGIGTHLEEFFSSDVFVANASTLVLLDLKHLKNKTVIVDFLNPVLEKRLREVGVGNVIVCMPTLVDNPYVNFSIFEGLLQVAQGNNDHLQSNDILNWIDKLKLSAQVTHLNQEETEKQTKFAFIVHPLRAGQLFMHPALRWFKPYSRPFEGVAENVATHFKGGYFGNIKGIVSEKTGKEVEGIVYYVPDTPKKLMSAEPTDVYKKLLGLCQQAKHYGASIIGLGAYTKIVGDAGVSLAKKSPIPVTTGNSLSAAATLWAAKLAVNKMNLVKLDHEMYQGQAMVVGATGSIGAVSARILAKTWKKLVLVAPRAYRLLELKDEILAIAPDCEISVATSADDHLPETDLVITSTSSQGKKILDIMRVKPGAVICDVSRPFDITEAEAIRRPDVMVIASGEVHLPGQNLELNVELGLEGQVVYACLAEAALLAMEGRFEPFTLSKNIHYEKVLEIDKMAKEHGVRLAAIMGHNGVITDYEFELCRKHAKKKLKDWPGSLKKSEE